MPERTMRWLGDLIRAVQTAGHALLPGMGRLDANPIGNTAESCLSDQNAIAQGGLMQCILRRCEASLTSVKISPSD
jgi:hypothetical protein